MILRMHPDPRTYIAPETSYRIGLELKAIREAYDDQRAFMHALRDVPGTHGIRDISVAVDSITHRERGPSIVNLTVIIDTEPGIDRVDAESWVTSALDGYSADRPITYEFGTPNPYPPTAPLSIATARAQSGRVRDADELLERLRTIHS
jgi:hypothetical protein